MMDTKTALATDQEIIEGNKIIAEFMNKSYQFEYDLQYHSSWSWLMPVVEKIENLWIGGTKAIFKIEGNCVEVWHSVGYNNIDFAINLCEKDKITNLWLSIIEFINWYNTTQLKINS